MDLTFRYLGHSDVRTSKAGLAVALAPNLRRDRVSYAGTLRHPLRFREAISALHEVVVSDLRYKPRDRSAYLAYRAEQARRESSLRQGVAGKARQGFYESMPELPEPFPPDLEKRYASLRGKYWKARLKYSSYLLRHDPELWRLLMPCDPIITVAPDVIFFECFSSDESSYGCLTLDRDAFSSEQDVTLGTTNVDYSWTLYEHFQRLRSYRDTHFAIDPAGFEVRTHAAAGYREEKIELPASWLRGLLQLQAAMSLPMRKVPLSREGLYNILAFLKRHRAARSPRAIRFELEPGQPVAIVLEPWDERIILHDTLDTGSRADIIRVWGRDRLRTLARVLPLLETAEVYLLGTGLPSFWSIGLGEMRLLLGLSGWTANDWSRSAALDQLAPPAAPSDDLLGDIAAVFGDQPSCTFEQIRQRTGASAPYVAAGLNRLALLGQVIHDLPASRYRWRAVMPVGVALDQVGSEHPETEAAKQLVRNRKVHITRDDRRADGLRILEGTVGERPVSLLLDADLRMLRARCTCSHHYTGGLRQGPCRHLQALRSVAASAAAPSSLEAWFHAFWH